MLEVEALVGSSQAAAAVREEIQYAALSDAKVLITGESGVGKEIVARLIHAGSARRGTRMVTVNCAGIPDTLLESELFGHVRGSFTGAYRDKVGLLQTAHRGTLMLDEIGETSLRMQGLLLRFLERGEIQPVGSTRTEGRVDVRIIASTNRNLFQAISDRTFREDLYYRLNVLHLYVPPLRERLEDVSGLLSHFLRVFAQQYEIEAPTIEPEALALLSSYSWPGNVRELRNVIERLVVRYRGSTIGLAELPIEIAGRTAKPMRAAAPQTPSRSEVILDRMLTDRQPFWEVVYRPFMDRDLTRDDLRAVITKGLEYARGNYKILVELFNMPAGDYKRFLNFLRKYQCHVAFQQFRTAASAGSDWPEAADGSAPTGTRQIPPQ